MENVTHAQQAEDGELSLLLLGQGRPHMEYAAVKCSIS